MLFIMKDEDGEYICNEEGDGVESVTFNWADTHNCPLCGMYGERTDANLRCKFCDWTFDYTDLNAIQGWLHVTGKSQAKNIDAFDTP